MKALFDNGDKFDNIQENLKGLEPYLNSRNNINEQIGIQKNFNLAFLFFHIQKLKRFVTVIGMTITVFFGIIQKCLKDELLYI